MYLECSSRYVILRQLCIPRIQQTEIILQNEMHKTIIKRVDAKDVYNQLKMILRPCERSLTAVDLKTGRATTCIHILLVLRKSENSTARWRSTFGSSSNDGNAVVTL
jgi:hypothetical protein